MLYFMGIYANDVCSCPYGSSHCPYMPTFMLYRFVLRLSPPTLLRTNYTPLIYLSLLLFKYLFIILSLFALFYGYSNMSDAFSFYFYFYSNIVSIFTSLSSCFILFCYFTLFYCCALFYYVYFCVFYYF